MSKKSKSTDTNTYTPNAATTALFNLVFANAQAEVNTPFQAYAGPMAAGLTGLQTQAADLARQGVGAGRIILRDSSGGRWALKISPAGVLSATAL